MGLFRAVGSESWVLTKREVFDMKCLKRALGMSAINKKIRDIFGIRKNWVKKVQQNIWKWFGSMKRIEERRLAKKMKR